LLSNFTNFGLLFCRENAVNEVTSGIREYFNVMLGSQLLYKFERQQYAKVILHYNWGFQSYEFDAFR
jgi:MRG